MRGSCIDVVDSFRTLVDASTRHLDLPSTGNEDRATVIGCCNYANARIQPVHQGSFKEQVYPDIVGKFM